MTERLIRLLRIIYLIQGNPGILARELAERCEASDRTIYRDLELLSTFVPISHLGYGEGYAFIGDFGMYPLNWTEQEAMAFTMLPSLVEQMKPLLPPSFDSAYEKVMATYQREQKNEARIVEKVASIIQMGTPAYRDEETADFLTEIIQATLQQKTIQTVYHTQSRNEQSHRNIDPYFLVPRDQRFYLIGHCHSAGQVRIFRVSRFKHIALLEQTFDKGDFNVKSYLHQTWSIFSGEDSIRFKVRFSKEVARYVKEEELFVKPKLIELEDGGLIFEVILNHDLEFLGWLAQYGPDAEILEPLEYRRAMIEKLDRWREVYGHS